MACCKKPTPGAVKNAHRKADAAAKKHATQNANANIKSKKPTPHKVGARHVHVTPVKAKPCKNCGAKT